MKTDRYQNKQFNNKSGMNFFLRNYHDYERFYNKYVAHGLHGAA